MVSERTVLASLLSLASIDKDDWETALQEILRVDAEVLGLARVNYWSLRRDPPALYCEKGYVSSPQGFERGALLDARDAPSYFHEIERARLIAARDALADPRTRDLGDYLRVRQIASLLDVPIWVRGTLVGVLCHEHVGEPRAWTETDLDFAVSISQVVAATLEARRRDRAESAARRAAFLDHASRALGTSLDPRLVAECALTLALPQLADGGYVDVLDSSGKLERVAVAHVAPEKRARLVALAERFPPSVASPHLSSRVAQRGEALLLPDIEESLIAALGLERQNLENDIGPGVRSVVAVPLLAGPRTTGALLLLSDQRRYDNEDLRLAQDFAVRVSAALENARAHLDAQQAIHARDEFISLAAHELHSPLASLQLAAESLAEGLAARKDGDAARKAGAVVRQVRRLNLLVDHMLDAARVGARRLAISPARMDLSRLVREVVRSFDERFRRGGTEISIRVQDGLEGRWDSLRLEQVLSNLLDNAVKFAAGKSVEVALERVGDDAILTVWDSGIGIAPARLRTIFDPFERAVSARSYGGLGLGLFVARAIVEAHGGRIDVTSSPKHGTLFRVRLPGVEPAPCLEGPREGSTSPAPESGGAP